MKYAILIPHLYTGKNSCWLTEQCLKSIKKFEPKLLEHTMILDDGSSIHGERTRWFHELQKRFPITVAFKRENTSYSDNLNIGIRLAQKYGYDAIVTLNNDVELKTPFQEKATEIISAHPGVGIIGARLYYPNGKLQHQGFTVNRGFAIHMHEAGNFETTRPPGFMMGVTGAYQIIRLSKLGEYPTQYRLGYEDVAYCLRAWEKGVQVWYEPSIVAVHCESATRGSQVTEKELDSFKTLIAEKFDWDAIEKNLSTA